MLQIVGRSIRFEQEEQTWYSCRVNADVFFMIRPVDKISIGRLTSTNDIYDKLFPFESIYYHIGACIVDDVNNDIVYYMDCAYAAMKESKIQYGKDLKWFDDTIKKKMDREQLISSYADTAIIEKQFVTCFQPKYDYENGVMFGAEALLRWNHPVIGMLSPREFIPLFEKNGFITKLSDYILHSVCEQLVSWKKEGYKTVPVSVNISRREIENIDYAEKLHSAVSSYGLLPSDISFEITEQAYFESPEKLRIFINKIHRAGYKVELDNYGSAYKSQKRIMDISVDMLKLDSSIIESLVNGENRENVMSMFMQTAQLMGIPGVAQGVETNDVAESLKEMGCTMMQGYLFSKPLFTEEFEKLLSK